MQEARSQQKSKKDSRHDAKGSRVSQQQKLEGPEGHGGFQSNRSPVTVSYVF